MSTTNLDAYDLSTVSYGGLIKEDVMSQIWDISKIPLPLSDLIGRDSHGNEYTEWTTDELSAPSTANKVIDGADVDQDDSVTGDRVGNHSQTSVKMVKVSTRAQNSDTIGFSNALAYQVMRRQQELMRDIEASMLSNNASIAGTSSVAGQSAGLQAWITTNVATEAGSPQTYAAGGFSSGTVSAMTPGTPSGLTESKVREVCQSIYEGGGNPSIMMGVPKVIKAFSNYLFSSTTVAQIRSNLNNSSKEPAKAQGSVDIFVTDFGISLRLVPNRLQQNTTAEGSPYTEAVSAVFLIDPMYLKLSFLHGPRVDPIAKSGLSDKRLMSADWTLKVLTEKAHGCIPAVLNDTAVVA